MLITFLSDYGYQDEFVGVCHGVIAQRCPQARVIDITHAIPRHDIRAGALALAGALPYMPPGVHLAVVDPGVGSARRAIALRTAEEGRVLVGPDNGLLAPAWERFGGPLEAVEVGNSRARLPQVSNTFHGRDVFAPVAAALAAGVALGALGEPLRGEGLTVLEPSRPRLVAGALATHVLRRDGFGNLTLDARAGELAALGLRAGGPLLVEIRGARHPARYVSSFADVPAGELLLYEDSLRLAALAVNRGSAAALLALEDTGEEIRLRPA